ncbi:hypothetical protein [Brevibacterium atlanticum]|uniref:hypothetical protein n=1 Tax=Brevibacterium atlanticum TaxID=2697563 RepID=UPI0014226E24|nr:hypothetical protein [Brevibacterium atlanticum]
MSTPESDTQRVTKGRVTTWVVLCLIPVIAAFVLQWLPILNGPHLFLGLPAILWWTCIPGSLLVTGILLIIEKTRPDLERQGHLDDLALEEAEQFDTTETDVTAPTRKHGGNGGDA